MPNTKADTALESAETAIDNDRLRMEELQKRLAPLFRDVLPDRKAPRTVVIVPSMSFDEDMLSRVKGSHLYEERMLCMLMLLRSPRTKIIFVTSMPIEDSIVDYYLQMLPGVPHSHSGRRLKFFSCSDPSPRPLSKKILERPELIEEIKDAIDDPHAAKITTYNSTPLERSLALKLGLPIYACDPELLTLGSKSGSRGIFRELGLDMPYGHEHLSDEDDIAGALSDIKKRDPSLRRAVIKQNFSGDGVGNAIFDYAFETDNLSGSELTQKIKTLLPELTRMESPGETWDEYSTKFKQMGGVAESWIEGTVKRSPSAQFKIDPVAGVRIESTHDQVLGGLTGQTFTGCAFPADQEYRLDIQNAGSLVADYLKEKGVLNVLSVDFVSVKSEGFWKHYAIEVNLRKGGTTFPNMTLRFLTDGCYDPETGLYTLRSGEPRYYYSSDNLHDERYKGLTPDDLIDIMVYNGLHFDSTLQTGAVFHMLSAIRDYGKFGVTCIGESRGDAKRLYDETISAMNSAIES